MPRRQDLPPQLCAGPFRVADAEALGVSRHVVGGHRFRRLFRGVHALADLPDTSQLRFDAVRLLLPDAVASHHTAAALRGLPHPECDQVWVTVPPPRDRPRIEGVRAHLAPVDLDVSAFRGRPVLSVERTMVDLAAVGVPLVELVVFGDAAVRRGWTTPAQLINFAGSARGRGVRVAREAAGLVCARVDSPMETRLRLLLVLAGLPTPHVNRPVHDQAGWVATPDLSYPESKIALEYDGDHHRTDGRQWRGDKRRRRLLRDLGWDLLECTSDDVYRQAQQTLAWVHERLLAAAYPGVPSEPSVRWRAHWA